MGVFKHLIIPTDFSPSSADALKHALALAAIHKAEVTVMHVVTMFEAGEENHQRRSSPTLKFLYHRLKRRALKKMDDFIEQHRINRLKVNRVVVSGFSVAEEILQYISENRIDFLIIGTHGHRAVTKMLIGSVTDRLMKLAPCPVMITKENSFTASISDYRQILVGIDFSENSIRALHLADKMAIDEAILFIMHIIENVYSTIDPQVFSKIMPNLQRSAAKQLQKVINKTISKHRKYKSILEVGYIFDVMANYAEKERIDLIFLGAKGMMSEEAIPIGHVPEGIIRKTTCPVIVVK